MTGVVMLVNEFPPLPVGGAETQAERLSACLARRGWKVWVVTRHADGLPSAETRSGFEILRPKTLGGGKMRTLTFIFFSLLQLYRMRAEYQILHAHLAFGPAFAAALLGRLLGKRVVVKLGGSNAIGDIHVSLSTLRGRIRLAAIRRWADVVIALTEVMREEALSVGISPERIRLFNNGIDAAAYFYSDAEKEQARKELGLSEKIVLLFIGRLDPVKSLPTALAALALALQFCPALHFLIVGDGPEKPALEEQARALGVSQHVTFTGVQKNVRPYLQAADIFLLPSLTEGISNALLEAMSAGLACLTTPVGGSYEALAGGKYGKMAAVEDAAAWAAAFVELGNDPAQRARLGALARQRIMEEYDFDIVGARYEALYRELLGDSSP